MRKKLLHQIIFITILLLCIFSLITPNVYADKKSDTQDTSISDIFTKADEFVDKGNPDGTIDDGSLKNMSELLYNTLLIVAIVIAVIIGIFIGIQFMVGSVEQKAKIKETLIPYIAGCIVVFGGFTIWKIVVTILQNAPPA